MPRSIKLKVETLEGRLLLSAQPFIHKPAVKPLPATITHGPGDDGMVTITGKTFAKTKVKVISEGDVETVKSDKKGHFQIAVYVGYGLTDVQLSAKSGKKRQATTLEIERDTPNVPGLWPILTPTPTPLPTQSPTPTPTQTPTPTPTSSPTPTQGPQVNILGAGAIPGEAADGVSDGVIHGVSNIPNAPVTLFLATVANAGSEENPSYIGQYTAYANTTTDASGNFEFTNVPQFEGYHYVAAITSPTLILSNELRAFPSPFPIPSETPPPLQFVEITSNISGTLQGKTREPNATVVLLHQVSTNLPGSAYLLSGKDFAVVQTSTADANGYFQFTGLDSSDIFIVYVPGSTPLASLSTDPTV
jgi:hypothetical protein